MNFTIPTTYTAVDRYSSVVNKMASNTAHFAAKAHAQVSRVDRAFRRVNAPLKKLNSNITTMAGITIGGALVGQGIRSAIDSTVELDDSLSAAAAKFGIFDRNSEVFKKLEEKAREMGKTTRFTAGQAAEGLKNLATAGFTADQAISGLRTVLDLATATQSELGQASEVAAKTLAAFGLKADDPLVLSKNLNHVSDVLNKIITTSGFGNLEEFLTTIGRSGATAKSAGVDITTWGAVVASTVSEAKDASTAGTEFSNALTMLAGNAKKFKGFGVKIADEKGNFRDFLDILGDVQKRTEKMGSATRAAKLEELFGKQGGKTMQILLAKGVDSLRAYRKELRDSQGQTSKMAAFMEQSFGGKVASAISAFQEAGIAFVRNFQGEIDRLIQRIIKMLRETGTWIKQNKELLKTGAKLLLWFGKAFIAFKALQGIIFAVKTALAAFNIIQGISFVLMGKQAFALRGSALALKAYAISAKVVTAAQWLWNAAMTANPIGLIIVGIAALIALIAIVVKKWNSWGAALSLTLGPFGMLISLIQSFRRNWDLIQKAFSSQGILAGLKMIGATLIDAILMPVHQLLKLVSKIPGIGDLAAGAAEMIQNLRRNLGVNIQTDEAGVPLANTSAEVEQTRTERNENLQRNQLDININDPGKNAQISDFQVPLPGINISSTQTY